jgi:predicted nucleotidyltransferase
MITKDILDILNNWATSQCCISRLWIFGSRTGKDYTENSDIDIAIEISGYSTEQLTGEDSQTFYFCNKSSLSNDIQQYLPWHVDLFLYDTKISYGTAVSEVNKNGLLVFDRYGKASKSSKGK